MAVAPAALMGMKRHLIIRVIITPVSIEDGAGGFERLCSRGGAFPAARIR
jgi:hypothetical protein